MKVHPQDLGSARNRLVLLTGALAVWVASFSAATFAEDAQPTETKAAAEVAADSKAAKQPNDWLRVRRDEKKQPLALETSIVRFVSQDPEKKDLSVDLIGAVHIGDQAYYETLNKKFAEYDVVLYELVAPEGTRIPKGGRKNAPAHPIAAMQVGMQTMLGLAFQLDHIDYTPDNLVHADMTPEEMTKSMESNNESTSRTVLRAIGQAMAQQASAGQKGGNGSGDIGILMDMLFTTDPAQRAHKMKLNMAGQFENLEGQMFIFEGDNGSTIINLRNKKALEVLDKQLASGKKKIGIFYGAGHLADFADRLTSDYKLEKSSVEWLEAWSLLPPKSGSKPAPAQPEAEAKPEAAPAEDSPAKAS